MCEIKDVKGVLDRFADRNQAVILIEEINKEIIIPRDELPIGSKENTWFSIKLTDDKIESITIDEEKSEEKLQSSIDLMDQLRSKSRSSKFKRK